MTVRAAGGVVWRQRGGELEIAVVSRRAYGDWSLPKGKLTSGESDEEAAVREVEEETGLLCRIGLDLGTISYRDARDRPKIVHYFEMRAEGGTLAPDNEIEATRWLPFDDARAAMTFPLDAEILDRFHASHG